MTDDLIERQE